MSPKICVTTFWIWMSASGGPPNKAFLGRQLFENHVPAISRNDRRKLASGGALAKNELSLIAGRQQSGNTRWSQSCRFLRAERAALLHLRLKMAKLCKQFLTSRHSCNLHTNTCPRPRPRSCPCSCRKLVYGGLFYHCTSFGI